MNAAENITAKKLVELGVTEPDQAAPLFAQVRARFDDEALRVHDEESWKLFRDAWLGRKSGVLTQITDNWLKLAGPALKPVVGAALNQLRAHVEPKIEALHSIIDSGADVAASPRDRVDLSLPGIIRPVGSRHLIRQVFQEIEDIFFSIGFSVAEGPEIETPYYNFEALNIPEFHPVRDDMDT
jgi:phenylalanyl-tRNA synthetase alpha chain